MATSAIRNAIVRPWLMTWAPILINFSFRLGSDQSLDRLRRGQRAQSRRRAVHVAGTQRATFQIAELAAEITQCVETLLNDPALAERVGREGRRFAIEHFNWSSSATQLVAFYRRLLRR